MNSKARILIKLTKKLSDECDTHVENIIENNSNIDFVYNPLNYAWKPHKHYLEKYGTLGAKTIIMGMNPGHGMGNTGIPFGCPEKVKSYLEITDLEVKEPSKIHPKREIKGLQCEKAEISGKRIWSLIEEIHGLPTEAFKHIFVLNHFPLWMFNAAGQNITPDKLKSSSTKEIFDVCNQYLVDILQVLGCKSIIGVGKYAQKMAHLAIVNANLGHVIVDEIPHPSPANPLANKDKGNVWKKISSKVIKKNTQKTTD